MFAYKGQAMSSKTIVPVLALGALIAACASPSLGPPPPAPAPTPSAEFSAADFAWSQRSGSNVVAGQLAYRKGSLRFTCANSTVVLTPETPWSRRRMAALYGSTDRAALPSDDVRARTPNAPAGDAGPYVKRATCDDADQFAFAGLADGAWFAITIAQPVNNPKGASIAVMRRVVIRGGKRVPLAL